MENGLIVRRSARLMGPSIKELDKYIHQHDLGNASNNRVCLYAIYYGHVNIVRILLTIGRVDPTCDNNGARSTVDFEHGPEFVVFACKHNKPKVLDVLLEYERVIDPRVRFPYNNEFIFACEKGRLDIVKVMLKDPRLDPSTHRNYPLQLACTNGHVHVVKLLLQYQRVDPSADRSYALGIAHKYGYCKIVDLLLNNLSEGILDSDEEPDEYDWTQ